MKQALLVCALIVSVLSAARGGDAAWDCRQAWDEEWRELASQIANGETRGRPKAEALDPQALILNGDNDPLDVVLRRTGSLVQHFRREGMLPADVTGSLERQWQALATSAGKVAVSDTKDRKDLYDQVCALRRRAALANPLLDFDSVVCMLERPTRQRIVEAGRPFGYAPGGGPVIVSRFKSKPTVQPLVRDVPVASGEWEGKKLTKKFAGLELGCDAKAILFSATTDGDVWHIFRYDLVSKKLVQLTEGPDDDFDPCFLPSGRIAFVSTRVGGIGRCLLRTQSLTYTLYSMEADGSDIVPLSYHETNEWRPSVNNQGLIVYTRWDYVDRDWSTAHHHWLCHPDGTDPRSYHGNYPLPVSAMPDGVRPSQYGRMDPRLVHGRYLRPDVELDYRAVPGTASKYVATAVGHHTGFSGSLVLVDISVPDDGKMAQVKRITPLYAFPEVEGGPADAYGTPWPLNEDFWLCNFKTALCLLDRYGNREVLFDPGGELAKDPFPLRARSRPPIVPVKTWDGKRESLADHGRATLSVMNVYDGDIPLPKGVKVKWMRIVQIIPQQLTRINREKTRLISYADESIGRIPLGVVPVEEDGSVFCEAPVGKPLYFQLLDEQGMAVQSMRSVTYAHPGEQLSCAGCHENKWEAPKTPTRPLALRRAPSKILPEVESGAAPFSFHQLVKVPVFDKKCVSCHRTYPKAPDMSYASLARADLLFTLHGTYFQLQGGDQCLHSIGIGGSRTTPGRFGAQASGLMESLRTKDYHKDLVLSADELRRLTLWLDMNANEICWISDEPAVVEAQKRGELVWPPPKYVDPDNVTAVEKSRPVGFQDQSPGE